MKQKNLKNKKVTYNKIKENEMIKKQQQKILFYYGLLFTVLGITSLIYYFFTKKDILFGDIIIYAIPTSIFFLFIGIISLILSKTIK